jgi:arsenite transporter
MVARSYNVLFLCTGNSARSILAEAVLNNLGQGRFRAYSAGSHPAGRVNPFALELLQKHRLPVEGLRSKSWDEFAQPGAPALDFVFTVCDSAVGEVCPIWPGQPVTAHWGVEDPAAVEGTDEAKRRAFLNAFQILGNRIRIFASLRLESLDRLALDSRLREIGKSPSAIGFFERWLTLWVFLCIVAGIALGQLAPAPFQALGRMEVARVNVPVGLLIWIMIIPMLLRIDFAAIGQVRQHMRGIGVTLFVNWAVKPFSMALLGWIFIRHVFAPYLPADQIDSYIAGLILLAAAPCTAMVFVWSQLSKGDPYFTLSQVALNDTIMIVAFAPIVGLLLGLSAITVPWDTLFVSVVLYIVIPVILAQLGRKALLKGGGARLQATLKRIQPFSVAALLVTLVLLFAFQGEQILNQPLVIAMLAVPILIQVYFNSGLAYLLNKRLGVAHCVAGPSALIGASNFFELAVAAAISLFGFNSGAALATVVGVLIEVPVMLSVVAIVNRTQGWYEARAENS